MAKLQTETDRGRKAQVGERVGELVSVTIAAERGRRPSMRSGAYRLVRAVDAVYLEVVCWG